VATEYTEVFDTILKDTVPELPGALRAVAKRELRLAMREFFEKSHAWVTRVEAIALPSGRTPVQVDDGDANTEIIAILKLSVGNDTDGYRPLAPMPERPLSVADTSTDPVAWFASSNPDEFIQYPYPTSAPTNVAIADVALIPAFDTELLPRQITLKYYEAIVNGFLARMYSHPNKPYSAPSAAGGHRLAFVSAMGYYAAQRKQGYNGAPNWRFPLGWQIPKAGR
jgi:hypothetical protein